MDGTLIESVMDTITRRIAGRSLAPGARLPSVRGLSRTLAVSTSTVVEAYGRLAAGGAIVSRPGSGFYVASLAAPLSLSDVGPRLDREVDPLWVSRQSLEAGGRGFKPGCGWLPSSWMPQQALRRSLRRLASADEAALADYGSPLGLPALRQLIARRMAGHGIEASPDRIMLTESGTQAIDMLCRFLIQPGDAVLVDDPCYFNFQALLRAHRALVVGVPWTAGGPDPQAFARALAEHQPRLYITNSAIQNPTGATLQPGIASRILELAGQHALTIVEDDIFADFEHKPAPRLAALDGLEQVIHIGSFSKTLSASARCGYIAARPEWIDGLVDLKIATTFGGGRLDAELVHSVLSDPGYRRHLETMRARLASARSEVGGRLRDLGVEPWIEPDAGMFLWCRLPDGLDAAGVARAALARDVVLAPGNVFSPSQTATGHMRFNVSQMLDPVIFDVLRDSLRKPA